MGDEPVLDAEKLQVHEIIEFESEVKTDAVLKLNKKCPDLKINMLQFALQCNGVKFESIVILTETDHTARIFECPPNQTPQEKEQYIQMTSIHNFLLEYQKQKLFQDFLKHKTKIIVLTYDLMESFLKKYKKIKVDRVYVYDVPKNREHFKIFNPSSGLIMKDGYCAFLDSESKNQLKFYKTWANYNRENGLRIPECLLN